MCMLDHRLQILLDAERYQKVAREAARRGTSIAAVIREAIDRLPAEGDSRHVAIAAILAAEPMPVPADPAELRRELDVARDRADW
ncbi:MAG: antitoxin [Chloroflexi bacterium]|nr:antitoxin [Chloroflexota bacterium]